MLEIASKMILCLLLAALLGLIIGYILGRRKCEKETTSTSTSEISTVPQAAIPVINKPMILTAPRNGEKDNLTRIKGIGIKIEASLNEVGIYHFDQISKWNDENIAWADQTLGFPGRAKREQWVEQAKALDAGEETEFSKRVDKGEVSSSKKA